MSKPNEVSSRTEHFLSPLRDRRPYNSPVVLRHSLSDAIAGARGSVIDDDQLSKRREDQM